MFWITVQQKRELKTYNVLKYGDSHDPYCSIECQQKHLKDLAESEFLDKSTLKNREYALIVHGVDVTRRPKEKEVHIITGTVTEQRAGCLRVKLISTFPRGRQKYLSSKEVQQFLLRDLPAGLKPPSSAVKVAAYDTINKTKELFPDEVSIERLNGNSRMILYIK